MAEFSEEIEELSFMKKSPQSLSYSGNIELIKKTKVSIVGTRKPSKYSRQMTQKLASELSKHGVCVVSGAAMGIDAVAHVGAGAKNTIAVLPCGIDIKYPSVNKNLLDSIEKEGLLLSQFEDGFKSRPWSFVTRNELVVALGEVLVVSEAELDSGSMRSVEFALEMGKEIFVFPQRLGESSATNELLKLGRAKAIYDIDEFVARFSTIESNDEKTTDEFLEYCKTNPTYEDALKKYPNRIFEAELSGEIDVVNSRIVVK